MMKVTTAYNLLKFQPCILFNRLDLWNTFITRDSTQHQMLTIFLIICLEDESTVGQSVELGGGDMLEVARSIETHVYGTN